MGLAPQLQRQPRVNHEVPGSHHQARDALDGGDLVDVGDALDGLDLRDHADVAVGGGDVEVVGGVEGGVGYAGGEGPGGEGAVA